MTPREAYVKYVKTTGSTALKEFNTCATSKVLDSAINKFNNLIINTQANEQPAEM